MNGAGGRGLRAMYILSGIAALLAAIVFRRWLGAELEMLAGMGVFRVDQPSGVEGWLRLLRESPLAGLALLNGLDVVNYLLLGLIFTGLFFSLRGRNKPFMALSLALVFSGIALFLSSNKAFALLALSRQDLAGPDALSLLQTGRVMLAQNDPMAFGTGQFWALVFVDLAGLIASLVMLRSGVFGRVTSWIGIIANAVGLGYFFSLAFYPPAAFVPTSLSAPFRLAWFIMIAVRLFRLSREAAAVEGLPA